MMIKGDVRRKREDKGGTERVKVVQDLWERRLLMTRYPLDNHCDD